MLLLMQVAGSVNGGAGQRLANASGSASHVECCAFTFVRMVSSQWRWSQATSSLQVLEFGAVTSSVKNES